MDWKIHVEGIPSLDLELRMSPESERRHQAECMVGAAIPLVGEVMRAEPGILLPRIFVPFKKRLL